MVIMIAPERSLKSEIFSPVLLSRESCIKVFGLKWFINNRGYAACSINRRYTLLHRFIMGLGPEDKICVDHINRNRLDNRLENLRLCSFHDNLRNKNLYKNNKVGLKGVDKRSDNCYRARIRVNEKLIVIGNYKTAIDAAIAYDRAAIELNGEFAGLNFPGSEAG